MAEELKEMKEMPNDKQNVWLCSYDHLIGANAFDVTHNIKTIQAEWLHIDNFAISISNAPNTHVVLSRKAVEI